MGICEITFSNDYDMSGFKLNKKQSSATHKTKRSQVIKNKRKKKQKNKYIDALCMIVSICKAKIF